MKTYLVGGAVRDFILGHEAHDRDYVVINATPSDMLTAGFKQVGADFPVFLHPETGNEYALARVERKVGAGYHGFSVVADGTVSLEDDLRRRDLTINAMAIEVNPNNHDQLLGELIDPYNGLDDLRHQLIRHTSEAFAEDPLRVLRVARFAAKLPSFSVSAQTLQLCTEMINGGMLKSLSQERIWLETYKALSTANADRYFATLQAVNAKEGVPGFEFLEFVTHSFIKSVLTAVKGKAREHDIALAHMLVGPTYDNVPVEASLKGLHTSVNQAATLLRMNWRALDPESTYDRLLKSGALRGQWGFIKDVLSLMEPLIVDLNEQMLKHVEAVTASQFPELTGKELGNAIKQARIKAIS